LRYLLVLILFPVNAFAQAILSEVLFNEPGSRVLLEWIEIYNQADSAIDLGLFRIVANSDTFALSSFYTVSPESYAVCARRLVAQDGGDSFEGHWGDSSGYWGDGILESFRAFEIPFSLPNDTGFVALIDVDSMEVDRFVWGDGSPDGISFERQNVSSFLSGWRLCFDMGGSTPGRPNSSEQLSIESEFSISVEPKIIARNSGGEIMIALTLETGAVCNIEVLSDAGKRLRTIASGIIDSPATFFWNGTNDSGKPVSPGVYILLVTRNPGSRIKSVPVVIAP